MWANCYMYNPPDTDVHKMANTLEKVRATRNPLPTPLVARARARRAPTARAPPAHPPLHPPLLQIAQEAYDNLDRTVAAEVAKGGENAQVKAMQKQMAEMKKMMAMQKQMLQQQQEMLRQQQLARRIAYLWRTLRRAVVLGPIVGYWMHVTAAPESKAARRALAHVAEVAAAVRA